MLPPVPPELQPYILDIQWDRRRLWALELPVEVRQTRPFLWHLELPWWKDGDRPFAATPRAVLTDPSRYPDQYARTLNADLRFPLHITYRAELKAVMLELDQMQVRRVPASAYASIRRREAA